VAYELEKKVKYEGLLDVDELLADVKHEMARLMDVLHDEGAHQA
jgi:hypothetical protein